MSEYANNPKAHFDYEILETIEAGIVLKGFEVKSIKTGKAQHQGLVRKNNRWQADAHRRHRLALSARHTPADYDPQASRKLLLAKSEVAKLLGYQSPTA